MALRANTLRGLASGAFLRCQWGFWIIDLFMAFRSNFIIAWSIVLGDFKIILIWCWGTFPCATGCIEGLSLPSLLRGTGIEGASLWTGAGGYLSAFFQLLLPILCISFLKGVFL